MLSDSLLIASRFIGNDVEENKSDRLVSNLEEDHLSTSP